LNLSGKEAAFHPAYIPALGTTLAEEAAQMFKYERPKKEKKTPDPLLDSPHEQETGDPRLLAALMGGSDRKSDSRRQMPDAMRRRYEKHFGPQTEEQSPQTRLKDLNKRMEAFYRLTVSGRNPDFAQEWAEGVLKRDSSLYLPGCNDNTRHHGIPYTILKCLYLKFYNLAEQEKKTAKSSSGAGISVYKEPVEKFNRYLLRAFLDEWNNVYGIDETGRLRQRLDPSGSGSTQDVTDRTMFRNFAIQAASDLTYNSDLELNGLAQDVYTGDVRKKEMRDFFAHLAAWTPGNLTIGPSPDSRGGGDPKNKLDRTAIQIRSDNQDKHITAPHLCSGIAAGGAAAAGSAASASSVLPQQKSLRAAPGEKPKTIEEVWPDVYKEIVSSTENDPLWKAAGQVEKDEVEDKYIAISEDIMEFLEKKQEQGELSPEGTRLIEEHIPFLLNQRIIQSNSAQFEDEDKKTAQKYSGQYFPPKEEKKEKEEEKKKEEKTEKKKEEEEEEDYADDFPAEWFL